MLQICRIIDTSSFGLDLAIKTHKHKLVHNVALIDALWSGSNTSTCLNFVAVSHICARYVLRYDTSALWIQQNKHDLRGLRVLCWTRNHSDEMKTCTISSGTCLRRLRTPIDDKMRFTSTDCRCCFARLVTVVFLSPPSLPPTPFLIATQLGICIFLFSFLRL